MPDGHVLEFTALGKRFGAVAAVDGFSARVEPGMVTGFLGPNGAGKTTTLRMLLGLISPTTGTATIGGKRYRDLDKPLQTVGAALEASSFHPGRSGANHLKVYARAAGLPTSRIDEALGIVGLADVGGRKVGGYSLGMRQRLGLAYTLLGDPGVLVLDEPANGLDPEGIKWMRGFLRTLAAEGRTVLVSSHLLAEIQQSVDALLIIARGRLVFQGTLEELDDPGEQATLVDAPDRAALTAALTAHGIDFQVLRSGVSARGADPIDVGAAAAAAGVALSTLQRRGPALEEVFLDLVNGLRVHASAAGEVADAGVAVPPAAEEPVAEEAPVAEPVSEAPPAEEPPVAEPISEERRSEEPDDEEPAAEESTTAEPVDEERHSGEPIVEGDDAATTGADTERSWDADHDRTDSDRDADAFFSRYDHRTEPDGTPGEEGEQR